MRLKRCAKDQASRTIRHRAWKQIYFNDSRSTKVANWETRTGFARFSTTFELNKHIYAAFFESDVLIPIYDNLQFMSIAYIIR